MLPKLNNRFGRNLVEGNKLLFLHSYFKPQCRCMCTKNCFFYEFMCSVLLVQAQICLFFPPIVVTFILTVRQICAGIWDCLHKIHFVATTLMLEEVSNKMTLCLWGMFIEQNQDRICDMNVQQATLAESVKLINQVLMIVTHLKSIHG